MKKVKKVQVAQLPDNGKKKLLREPENESAGVDAKRIRACPSLAHLSGEEAEELAAFIRLYCEAIFRIVEKEDANRGSKDGRGTSFVEQQEQSTKAA